MSDYQVGDTIYHKFTTRAFATGIPTVLAGTPVVSIYEDDSVTQITAGITLTISFDSVVGLNHLTVVATGGNGFEAGKFYQAVITTGTVGGVSVVGEVVWTFSLDASAAALDLANGTDGLGAIKTDTAAILVDTGTTIPAQITALNDVAATDIVSAGAITTLSGAIVNVDLVDTTTANTDMRGTDSAFLAASAPTNFSSMVISGAGAVDALTQGYLNTLLTEATVGRIAGNFDIFFENADAVTTQVVDDVGGGAGGTDWSAAERNEIRGRLGITGTTAAGGNTPTLSLQSSIDALNDFNPASDAVANVTLVATTTANTDMRGTDGANTVVPNNAGITANGVAIAALNDITAADVLAAGDIDGFSLEEAQKIELAALGGKLSGAATATNTIRAADDSKARITATVDAAGNRTAVTLDGTG